MINPSDKKSEIEEVKVSRKDYLAIETNLAKNDDETKKLIEDDEIYIDKVYLKYEGNIWLVYGYFYNNIIRSILRLCIIIAEKGMVL